MERYLSNKLYAERISKLEFMLSFYHAIRMIPVEKRLQCLRSVLDRINTILSSNTFPGSSLVKAKIMQQAFYVGHSKVLTFDFITTEMQLGLVFTPASKNTSSRRQALQAGARGRWGRLCRLHPTLGSFRYRHEGHRSEILACTSAICGEN